MKKKISAFTLAEVLITLAIIGIIAAITIPSIVANHQKRALETQFAKAYRTLSQAVNLAIAEHGDISTWEWKDSYTNEEKDKFVKKYFLPYLNYTKFCNTKKTTGRCFHDHIYGHINGTPYSRFYVDTYPQVQLADGSLVQFTLWNSSTGSSMTIYVDINGYKKPNIIGRDLFAFGLYDKSGEFLPMGINKGDYDEATNSYAKRTRESALQICKSTDSHACAAVIVQDGFKMNY